MTIGSTLRRKAFVEQVMGMPISVHVRGEVDTPEVGTGVRQVWSMLRRVDEVFSTWRADSQLMMLRRAELSPQHAHPWLAEVEVLCADATDRTAGLFSATAAARHAYDPTGLVKGWAVERAARLLAGVPHISFCINAGGDLVAGRGQWAEPSTWQVGIENPRVGGAVAATVPLTEGGLATSGNAARGAHILDPRDGNVVNRDGSATVWGPSLMWADVWATALFVDPDAGRTRLARVDPSYRSLVL